MLLLAAGVASAQEPTIDLQRLQPTGDGRGFVLTPSARRGDAGAYHVELIGSHGHGGLRRYRAVDGALVEDAAVQALTAAHLRGWFVVHPAVALELAAPIVQNVAQEPFDRVGVGDTRLAASVRLVDERALGVVVEPFVSFPTGSELLGRSVVVPGARVALSRGFGRLHTALTGGFRWLPESGFRPQEVGVAHEATVGLGVGVDAGERWRFNVEATGAVVGPQSRLARLPGYADVQHLPVELLATGRHLHASGLGVVFGGGAGLTPGVGVPALRVVLGVGWGGAVTAPAAPEPIVAAPEPEAPPPPLPLPLPPPPPPPDRDGDGVVDTIDRCPDIPGVGQEGGCPIAPAAALTAERIHISEQVRFAFGSAELDSRSEPVLRAVLEVLQANPRIRRVRIEGHADEVGSAEANLELSGRRAEAVEAWLVARGVDAARLDAEGFGAVSPLAPNDTEEGRQANRRVEFHVLAWEAEPQE